MKYLYKTHFEKIKDKYDQVIAWGCGPLFQMNYSKDFFQIDYIIDGTGKKAGKSEQGIEIYGERKLDSAHGNILIVIYTIYENQVLEQIQKHINKEITIDTIIFSLLESGICGSKQSTQIMNAKCCEDFLLLSAIRQIGLSCVKYLEIGVCHPIIRNNTYLLNNQFSMKEEYEGVLVEANPLCWDLIKEYRKNDKLLMCGIAKRDEKMPFYIFPNYLGHSTFVKEIAEKGKQDGFEYKIVEVSVKNINSIIEENFHDVPDILSLDAEGMDYEILMSWDYKKYHFKIIVSEIMDDFEILQEMMVQRGYKMYTRTLENVIWIDNRFTMHI